MEEAVRKQLFSHIASGNEKWYNPVEGNVAILAKLCLPSVLGIWLLRICTTDTLEKLSEHVYTRLFIVALAIVLKKEANRKLMIRMVEYFNNQEVIKQEVIFWDQEDIQIQP